MAASLPEVSVIGCLAFNAGNYQSALDLLTPEMFADKWLGEVFGVCKALREEGRQIDLATIEGKMGKKRRVDLIGCLQMSPTLCRVEDYCAAVLENWRVRQLCSEAFQMSQCDTSREWLALARQAISRQEAIENRLECSTATDFRGSAMGFMESLMLPSNAIRSGMREFDRVTGGLQRKSFYIIAGRSGLGKTDFALALALNMSAKYRVSFCSMEMNKEELMGRVASRIAQVDSTKIRDRTTAPAEMQRITEGLSQMMERTQLMIEEQQGLSADDLENKILRQTPDVLFVDHIGLMTHPSKKNTWEGVAETSKRLKQLAMKHNIVVVGLAQETRSADGNLKGSDNLTNDADGIFLMKSEPPKTFITGEGWIDAEVIVKKLRNGARGTLKYHWRPQFHEWRAAG